MRVVRFGALVAAGGLLLAAGCGKPGAAPEGGPKKLRMAGIVFQEDQFFRLVLFGMRDAAARNNVELLEGNSANKPEKEIELVNNYVSSKVDAILISPVSQKGSVAALDIAKRKGVIVIAHNTPVDGDAKAAYIESNAEDLGTQTGKAARAYIEQKLGGKAKIAIVAFRSLVPEQSDARTRGFKNEVKALPGVQFVAEQDAWLPAPAVTTVNSILAAHPDVDIIWSANEGGTIGSVLAVRGAGKAGKVVVFGTDASEQLLDFLKAPDNVLQAVTSQRPVEAGRLAVESAVKALRHEPFEKYVCMQGILLSRADSEGVARFEKQLKEWMGKGGK